MIRTIKNEIQNLIRRFGTNDPAEICLSLGINLLFCDLPAIQNGVYLEINNKKIIVINNRLPNETRNFYIAHELGHAVLHESVNYIFICQSTNFSCGKFEREADLFAALLLLSDCDCLAFCETKEDLSRTVGIPLYVLNEVQNIKNAAV